MVAIHDAEIRLWSEIESLHAHLHSDRLELGKRFLALRNLYSDRNSGGQRLTSGHGTFQFQIKARGYAVRTARSWIADYEASINGTKTQAQKRVDRRAAQAKNHRRACKGSDWADLSKEIDRLSGVSVLEAFVRLLPYDAARAAYLVAAKRFHPDHGGDEAKMKDLNEAWEHVERFYKEQEVTAAWDHYEYD